MRNFKRLAASLVALVLVVAFTTSCEKQPDINKDALQEITLNITNISNNLKKAINDQTFPECSDATPEMVKLKIKKPDGSMEYLNLDILKNLGNGTQTVVIKTKPGNYVLKQFEVYDIDGNMIWAAPKVGSEYHDWVNPNNALNKKFTVVPFKKLKIDIDVLCIDITDAGSFGYFWFEFDKVIVKNLCFFGDVCTKFYEDFHIYEGSPYVGQDYDGYDFPAIFKVLIKDAKGNIINDQAVNSNMEWQGSGAPLCIEYPDTGSDEMFTFEILLAYPDGTWPSVYESEPFSPSDDMSNLTGEDNIFDFVVGNCSYVENDHNLTLPPYIILPEEGRIHIKNWGHTGHIYKDYFEIALLEGFDNPLYPPELRNNTLIYGYCGDLYNLIRNEIYDVDIYSTLEKDLNKIPAKYQDINWGALNYLANLDIEEIDIDVAKQVQAAIWYIIHGINDHVKVDIIQAGGHPSQESRELAQRCLDNDDYLIKTGDWLVLLFDPIETEHNVPEGSEDGVIQLVLTRVDP